MLLAPLLCHCRPALEGGQSGTDVAGRNVDASWGGGSLQWEGGRTLVYRVGIFEQDGFLVVCSAIQGVRNGRDREAFSFLNVTANNEIIMRGLNWGESYVQTTNIDGQPASCRLTETAAVANMSFDTKLSRSRF